MRAARGLSLAARESKAQASGLAREIARTHRIGGSARQRSLAVLLAHSAATSRAAGRAGSQPVVGSAFDGEPTIASPCVGHLADRRTGRPVHYCGRKRRESREPSVSLRQGTPATLTSGSRRSLLSARRVHGSGTSSGEDRAWAWGCRSLAAYRGWPCGNCVGGYASQPRGRRTQPDFVRGDTDVNVSAGHTSWRSMAVLGGRACENPQDFREELGVQLLSSHF